jgi:hypothetical protein
MPAMTKLLLVGVLTLGPGTMVLFGLLTIGRGLFCESVIDAPSMPDTNGTRQHKNQLSPASSSAMPTN